MNIHSTSPLFSASSSRARLVAAALAAIALVAAACSSSTSSDGTISAGSIAGTYSLNAVGGKTLPAGAIFPFTTNGQFDTASTTFTAGTLKLNSDNSLSGVLTIDDKEVQGSTTLFNQVSVDSSNGTFSLNGNSISVLLQENGSSSNLNGTVSGNTISLSAIDTEDVQVGSAAVIDTLVLTFIKQ